MVENPPANAGDTGSSPGLGRPHMPMLVPGLKTSIYVHDSGEFF